MMLMNSMRTCAFRRGALVAPCGPPLSACHIQRRFGHQESAQSKSHARKRAIGGSKPAPYQQGENVGTNRYSHFDLGGKVFVVTGAASRGGRGLSLCMAEALVEAGGKVHCIDKAPEPDKSFDLARQRLDPEYDGILQYHQADVSKDEEVETVMEEVGSKYQRLDGLIAGAAIQQVTPALEYPAEDIAKMLSINYTGVFLSARACARQMQKYKIQGSMCFIASMSGTIANKGFYAPVYNSSKAAVIQLAKNLAMEWGRVQDDGSGGIRVNALSPGHILTPMVEENFRNEEADREAWEENSMLGRISTPEEYKAAALFLMSRGSSYMTGANLIMDGGCSAW